MRFTEVLRPPIWVLAFFYFLLLSLVLAVWAAFGTRVTLLSVVISTLCLIVIAKSLTMKITIDADELRVGKAHIELKYLNSATALDSKELGRIRTRDADPAAHLAIRFWMNSGVQIKLNDPRDRTPYWLITSKRGEELAALLNKK